MPRKTRRRRIECRPFRDGLSLSFVTEPTEAGACASLRCRKLARAFVGATHLEGSVSHRRALLTAETPGRGGSAGKITAISTVSARKRGASAAVEVPETLRRSSRSSADSRNQFRSPNSCFFRRVAPRSRGSASPPGHRSRRQRVCKLERGVRGFASTSCATGQGRLACSHHFG